MGAAALFSRLALSFLKVGAFGSPRKVYLYAKASPSGRGGTAGDGEGEDAAHEQLFLLVIQCEKRYHGEKALKGEYTT